MATRDAVSQSEAGTWDFQCPKSDGSCGADGVSFASTGWPTKALAVQRGQQHIDEHGGGDAMQELHTFRADNGLTDLTQPEA